MLSLNINFTKIVTQVTNPLKLKEVCILVIKPVDNLTQYIHNKQ
jgi:hypothetical protein